MVTPNPDGGPILDIRGVSKAFPTPVGPVTVLQDISLQLGTGEFVSLIGPSGCGKTTLLRIVAGLIPPTRGEVWIEGELSTKPSRRRGFVFQHFNLLPWRTVLSNACYGLELAGVGRAQARRAGLAQLEILGLRGFEGHFPAQISGGMKQRVGLARALLINPSILLMDEPFGALDALTREVMQEDLLRIWERKKVILFVTHSIDEAIFLSDRVVVMGTAPGRILQEFPVDLPRPRLGWDVRSDPRYTGLRHAIWQMLKGQVS